MTEDTETLTECPICKDYLLIPRIYPCGHHICEECMIASDKNTHAHPATLPIYKCPICRCETSDEWWKRPVDTKLISVLCSMDCEYNTKHSEHKKRTRDEYNTEIDIPYNINLAHICKNMREHKSEQLYKMILPLLYKAATEGKPYITISTEQYDIGLVADILAEKLIKRNGIYKMISGHRECQIELVPSERSYRLEYDNDNYNVNEPVIDNENQEQSQDNENDQENQDDQESREIGNNNQITLNQTRGGERIVRSSVIPTEMITITIQDGDNPLSETQRHHVGNMILDQLMRNVRQRSIENNNSS